MILTPMAILGAATFTVAVSIAAGRLALQAVPLRLYRGERWALSLPTGAACLSSLVFALCALKAAYPWVFLVAGVATILAAWRTGALRHQGDPLPDLPVAWKRTLALIFVPFGLLYLCHALSPEYSPDGSAYHLGVMARYLRAHGFERITTNMYANLSQGVDLLYLFALSLGKNSAAALVHLSFLFALPALLIGYARRFGFPEAGAFAAVMVFTSPLFGVDGSSAYIDVAVVALLFTVFYLVRLWLETPDVRVTVLIGLMAGFCYAAKYTAALAIPYALAVVAVVAWRRRLGWFRHSAALVTAALLMMTPWMVKNWLWLDNPFSPLFNRYFPNPQIYIAFEEEYRASMRRYEGVTSYWMLPAQVIFRGDLVAGYLGPAFALVPIALLGLRNPHVRWLVLAGLLFGSTYFSNVGARFLIPAAPFLALAMAIPLTHIRSHWIPLPLALVVAWLGWPTNTQYYASPAAWAIAMPDWRAALRIRSEELLLKERLGNYRITRAVEQNTPPDARILTFTALPDAYLSRDQLVAYESATGNVLRDILYTPLTPERVPTGRTEFRFPLRPISQLRIEQIAAGKDLWSIAEVRLYAQGKEVRRNARWRIRSNANPWDLAMAFDNSPVTRWRSWEAIRPGMHIDIDLGDPALVDAVVLETSNDQYEVRLRLHGRDADGKWSLVSDSPVAGEAGQYGNLRRTAALEVKSRGVDYFVVFDREWGGEDFRMNSTSWGITPVVAADGAVLYRIEAGDGTLPRR